MKFPTTAKQAVKYIEGLAKKKGMSVAKFCESKGVDPSVISRWRTQYKHYNIGTLLRFLK